MLETIKLLLGIASTDASKNDLLNAMIKMAEDEVMDFCHIDSVDGFDSIICEMVVENYNRLGSEGLSTENYSGVSFGYLRGYSDRVVNSLKARRKIITC